MNNDEARELPQLKRQHLSSFDHNFWVMDIQDVVQQSRPDHSNSRRHSKLVMSLASSLPIQMSTFVDNQTKSGTFYDCRREQLNILKRAGNYDKKLIGVYGAQKSVKLKDIIVSLKKKQKPIELDKEIRHKQITNFFEKCPRFSTGIKNRDFTVDGFRRSISVSAQK